MLDYIVIIGLALASGILTWVVPDIDMGYKTYATIADGKWTESYPDKEKSKNFRYATMCLNFLTQIALFVFVSQLAGTTGYIVLPIIAFVFIMLSQFVRFNGFFVMLGGIVLAFFVQITSSSSVFGVLLGIILGVAISIAFWRFKKPNAFSIAGGVSMLFSCVFAFLQGFDVFSIVCSVSCVLMLASNILSIFKPDYSKFSSMLIKFCTLAIALCLV